MSNTDLIPSNAIEIKAIPSRGLTLETCSKWSYGVASVHYRPTQVATFRDPYSGAPVGQKLRTKDKQFSVLGKVSDCLYGQHLWRTSGRRVIVCEGEIDAMTVSQVLDHKWPVVSIPNGASGARKALAKHLEWLAGFEEVVLCFDMDDPGREAVEECAALFPPGKVRIVTLPDKDPNALLVAGRADELVRALWDAKEYRPDGIVAIDDILDEVLQPLEMGLPWCLPTLTATTYGRRYGELVGIGAGTGIGKTTLLTQQVTADILDNHAVGVFAFEQLPQETIRRVAGQICGKPFHVPDPNGMYWSQNDLVHAVGHPALKRLFLYNHFGACSWDNVKERIRYLYHAHGVRIFYIDHITALAAAANEKENVFIEKMMAEMGGLVKELNCWILYVSHLSTPEGASHEEGGRVTIKHFKGSRSIGYWSHFMIGLERDQQADEPGERGQTVLRVLKDRYTGRSTGLTIPLTYDSETGLLGEGKAMAECPF